MSASATLATLSGRSDFAAIAKWIKPNAQVLTLVAATDRCCAI
jgi:hypothetical protein